LFERITVTDTTVTIITVTDTTAPA